MIIGRGLLASALAPHFSDDDEVVVLASGVSNSGEKNPSAFFRERETLAPHINSSSTIIYFSTCSIDDPDLEHSPYVRHKIEMEKLVSTASKPIILRLPQVVGNTQNPYTLTNYIYNHILQNKEFTLFARAERNLIDVSDIARITLHTVRSSTNIGKTINIATPIYTKIIDIVETFEGILKKKSRHTLEDKGSSYRVNTDFASSTARELGIAFNEEYPERTLIKYYGQQ